MAHTRTGSVVAVPDVPPGFWTADLLDGFRDGLPDDDGTRYEILDGELLVNPSPARGHQRMMARIYRALDDACPEGFEVYFAPLDWLIDPHNVLQPDILVVRAASWPYEPKVTDAPLLVVEVVSPSTANRDRATKFEAYARFGVAQYWIADPGRAGRPPSITVYDLDGDGYRRVTEVAGSRALILASPLVVTVVPDDAAGVVR